MFVGTLSLKTVSDYLEIILSMLYTVKEIEIDIYKHSSKCEIVDDIYKELEFTVR